MVDYESSEDEDGNIKKTAMVDYESSEDETDELKEMETKNGENSLNPDDDPLKLIFEADRTPSSQEEESNEATPTVVPSNVTETSADDDSRSYEQFEMEVARIVRDRKENSIGSNAADENDNLKESPEYSSVGKGRASEEEEGEDIIPVEGLTEEESGVWRLLEREVEREELTNKEGGREEDSERGREIWDVLEKEEKEAEKRRGTVEVEESDKEEVQQYEEEEIVLYFGKR